MRELKASLSQCIERAVGGEVVEVTRHRRTVARLVGVPAVEAEGLARLLGSGAAQWNGRKPPLEAPVVLNATGKSISRMVIEDRG